MNFITIGMFAAILAISFGITAWAARRTRTTTDFYAAGKGLTAAQNGFALAGDWCSAAAFLGFAGLTALYGMGGALYAVGPLVWERLDKWPLYTESFQLVANDTHRLAGREVVGFDDLRD